MTTPDKWNARAESIEFIRLRAELAEEKRKVEVALLFFKQFAECYFVKDNCASFDVANKRIRNLANKAIAALTTPSENMQDLKPETVISHDHRKISGESYSMSSYCANCGRHEYVYIKRGTPKKGLVIPCTKCGCDITL